MYGPRSHRYRHTLELEYLTWVDTFTWEMGSGESLCQSLLRLLTFHSKGTAQGMLTFTAIKWVIHLFANR